jgi:hypothetical protein
MSANIPTGAKPEDQEIEITPEMIEAGFAVLAKACLVDGFRRLAYSSNHAPHIRKA